MAHQSVLQLCQGDGVAVIRINLLEGVATLVYFDSQSHNTQELTEILKCELRILRVTSTSEQPFQINVGTLDDVTQLVHYRLHLVFECLVHTDVLCEVVVEDWMAQ